MVNRTMQYQLREVTVLMKRCAVD